MGGFAEFSAKPTPAYRYLLRSGLTGLDIAQEINRLGGKFDLAPPQARRI